MAKSVRTVRPGMSFVTTATRDRRPIFEISRVADLFIDTCCTIAPWAITSSMPTW